MAEEIDNTKKPKAELIKHIPSDSDEGAGKGVAEPGERRKVIVVKKKPVSGAPGQPVAKKVQPRIVVSSHAGTGQVDAASQNGETAAAKTG